MIEKRKNLLVLGSLAAVFAVALVLVLSFGGTGSSSKSSSSSQANLVALNNNLPYWYCEKVKNLWDEGDFTDRFGGEYDAASCKALYFENTWEDSPEYEGLYTSGYCDYVKDRWDEGGWTERFGDTYDPKVCKDYYFTNLIWSGVDYYEKYDWIDNPGDYEGMYTQNYCAKVKSAWDEGGWTERFGSTSAAATCKKMYYEQPKNYWNSSPNEFDEYWWNYIFFDDFSYDECEKIKKVWDEGDWTANYGSTYAPGICKDQYFYDDWENPQNGGDDFWWNSIGKYDFSFNQCEKIKNLWDEGDWTDHYGSSYAPNTCKDLYFQNDWNDSPEAGLFWFDYVDYYDFTYSQCLMVKQMWDQGNWTANYGSTYAPGACKDVYFEGDWEENNSVPPAGYEDYVYTSDQENPFQDTDIYTLEGQAAAYLYNIGVIGGYPDGEFKGWKDVNRAETAKFLLLARYGFVQEVANNGQFSDVAEGEWYVKFVVTAADLGIISGYPDGTFKPANTVNTAEFLKMMAGTFDLPLWIDYDYLDVDGNDWYAQYAGIASEYDLFPDRGNWLSPGSLLTREEVAIALYKYLTSP